MTQPQLYVEVEDGQTVVLPPGMTNEDLKASALAQMLNALDDDELLRLSRLPVEKAYSEIVDGVIIPSRAVRRTNARNARRRRK
jgi:hypothetical protein